MTREQADLAQRKQIDVICIREGHGNTLYRITEFIRMRDPVLNNIFTYSVMLEPLKGRSSVRCGVHDADYASQEQEYYCFSENTASKQRDLMDIAQRYNLSVTTQNKDCRRIHYKIKEFIRRGNEKEGFSYFAVLWNKEESKYALTDPVPVDEISIIPGWSKFALDKLEERRKKQAVESLKKELIYDRKN